MKRCSERALCCSVTVCVFFSLLLQTFETSVPIVCVCVCPAGEAVGDGGIEAADGGGGETEG